MLEDDSEPFLFWLGLDASGSHWLLRSFLKHDAMLVKITIGSVHVAKPDFGAVLLASKSRLLEFGTLTACLQCYLLQCTWGLPASLRVGLLFETFLGFHRILLLVCVLERLFLRDFFRLELYRRFEHPLFLWSELVPYWWRIRRVELLLLFCFSS